MVDCRHPLLEHLPPCPHRSRLRSLVASLGRRLRAVGEPVPAGEAYVQLGPGGDYRRELRA